MNTPLSRVASNGFFGLSRDTAGREPASTPEGHHGGNTYRPGEKRQAPARRAAVKPRAPARRRSSLQSAAGPDGEEQGMGLQELAAEGEHARLESKGGMDFDSDQGSGSKGGGFGSGGQGRGRGEGTTQPLRYKATAALATVDDLPRRLLNQALPGAAALLGPATAPAHPTRLLEAAGQLMLAAALEAAHATLPSSLSLPLTRTALVAAHACLARWPQDRAAPAGRLADAKSLLMAWRQQPRLNAPVPKDAPEAAGNALALLPLRLVNSQRPRTAGQHARALDKLAFILRTR